MKLRTYFKVDAKGRKTGRFRLRPDQVAKLNSELINGEKLMRHAPKKP